MLHHHTQSVFGDIYLANQKTFASVTSVAYNIGDYIAAHLRVFDAQPTQDQLHLIIGDALVRFGVQRKAMVYDLKHVPTATQIDIAVYSVRRNKPVFISARTSWRERWAMDERIAANLWDNRRGCVKPIFDKFSTKTGKQIVHSRSDMPEMWSLFIREHWGDTADMAKRKADSVARQATFIDQDKFLTVLDNAGMERLLKACL